MLSSSKLLFTSSSVVPLELVLARIVCTAFICVSYSWKPSIIGSIVIALSNCFPVSIAELAMLTNAVTPTTSKAENLSFKVSAELDALLKSIFLADDPTFSNPLLAPSNFKAFFSLSNKLTVSVVLLLKSLFSNFIETTRSSICLDIVNYLLPYLICNFIKNRFHSWVNIISTFNPTSVPSTMTIL